jgi:hypothetical protein
MRLPTVGSAGATTVDLEQILLTTPSKTFSPPHCPRDSCPSRVAGEAFLYRRRGTFRRKCDLRVVQRFWCCACRRFFSTQTFRLDFRLRKPALQFAVFDSFVSKVTQRQTARNLYCTRKTVVHRLALLSKHSQDFHARVLARVKERGGLEGDFQLDELETFEGSRRLRPVTMPALMEAHSYFVVHTAVGTLPARGKLRKKERERKLELAKTEGVRRSGSRAAVKACFEALARVRSPKGNLVISTDRKWSYGPLLREVMPGNCRHVRHSSTAKRDYSNPLFPINHTFAMLRDGLSRLVRRSWGASKQRDWLERHAWIWIAYRNYIRYITNRARHITSAQALGVVHRRFSKWTFFEWRVFSTP